MSKYDLSWMDMKQPPPCRVEKVCAILAGACLFGIALLGLSIAHGEDMPDLPKVHRAMQDKDNELTISAPVDSCVTERDLRRLARKMRRMGFDFGREVKEVVVVKEK